jgi:hypothetical protein
VAVNVKSKRMHRFNYALSTVSSSSGRTCVSGVVRLSDKKAEEPEVEDQRSNEAFDSCEEGNRCGWLVALAAVDADLVTGVKVDESV